MGNQCCSRDDPTNSGIHDSEPYPQTEKEMYGARVSSTHSDNSSEDGSFYMMNNSHMNVMPKRSGEMKLVLHMCEKEDDEK